MFLSNRPTLFFFTCIFALFSVSCGSESKNESTNGEVITRGKSEFPFSTKEPEVFQGTFVVSDGNSEKRWFLARSGDQWRFDIFRDGEPSITQLRTDKLYLIDHVRRSYCEVPQTPGLLELPDPILFGFFSSKGYRRFEDLGIELGLRRYKVSTDEDPTDDIIIFIDTESDMIVKQEFYEGKGEAARLALSYEVRDLKRSIDEGVLTIPAGFKLVEYDDFQQARGMKASAVAN